MATTTLRQNERREYNKTKIIAIFGIDGLVQQDPGDPNSIIKVYESGRIYIEPKRITLEQIRALEKDFKIVRRNAQQTNLLLEAKTERPVPKDQAV